MLTSVANGRLTRGDPHLVVESIEAGYGGPPIIAGVSLTVARGEIVAVIGANGSGKSTLLKAIAGVIPHSAGVLSVGGEDISRLKAMQRARHGVGYVPQSDDVFRTLTVLENLEIGGYALRRKECRERVDRVVEIFPALGAMLHRRASKLSGGERKMLAIGRALMVRPDVILLDEPTSNLSFALARTLLTRHVPELAAEGVAVLLVEQKAIAALEVAQWAYVLVLGATRLDAPASELLDRGDLGSLFLGQPLSSVGYAD